jgi:prepilin-type N-terminal cleavage/methylation domain-containing protein
VSRTEQGFTLPELLVSVAILGILAPVIGTAITLGLKVTSATTSELAASHNRQLLAGYFTSDVQSAVTIADDTSADTTTCVSSGQTLVGRLSWTDVDVSGTSTARSVAYVTATVSGEKQLIRNACTGATMASTVTVHGVVSGDLTCTSTTFATVACSTAAGAKLTTVDSAGSWVMEGLTR